MTGGEAVSRRRADVVAGWLAIGAGLCWFAWAVANTAMSHRLEFAPAGSAPAVANALLTAGWNWLIAPAAVRLYLRFRSAGGAALLAATVAGLTSVSLWALGGLTHGSHLLETTYLALAAWWLFGLGAAAREPAPWFGTFTLVVAAFTALDAAFNVFEPVPFAMYVLAAPKLPLSATWSIATGVMLITTPHGRPTA